MIAIRLSNHVHQHDLTMPFCSKTPQQCSTQQCSFVNVDPMTMIVASNVLRSRRGWGSRRGLHSHVLHKVDKSYNIDLKGSLGDKEKTAAK